jgi:hypothetical protein
MLQGGVTSGGRQRRWAAAAVLSGSEDAAAVRPGWQRGAGATTDLDGSEGLGRRCIWERTGPRRDLGAQPPEGVRVKKFLFFLMNKCFSVESANTKT